MCLTLGSFQDFQSIASRLKISKDQVRIVMEFLLNREIAGVSNGRYIANIEEIHISKDKPEIYHHHSNLRKFAMNNVYNNAPNDMFFSSFISCSKSDIAKMKKELITAINNCSKLIEGSEQKCLAGLNIDFYEY